MGIPDRLLLFLRRTTLEIAAAAAEVLDEHDQELLAAVFAVHKSLEAQRNDLAHGLFGVADQISDGLLWVEIKHQAPWTMDRISRWDATPSPGVIEHVYVYKAKALIDLHNEIATFGQNTMALATYYRSGSRTRPILNLTNYTASYVASLIQPKLYRTCGTGKIRPKPDRDRGKQIVAGDDDLI